MPQSKSKPAHSTVILRRKRGMNLMERAGLGCDSDTKRFDLNPGSNHCVPRELIDSWRRADPTLKIKYVPEFNTYIFE